MKNVQLTQQQINFIYSLINLFLDDKEFYDLFHKDCSVIFKSDISFNDIIAELNCLKNEFSLIAD
jgi:hypothetical protein